MRTHLAGANTEPVAAHRPVLVPNGPSRVARCRRSVPTGIVSFRRSGSECARIEQARRLRRRRGDPPAGLGWPTDHHTRRSAAGAPSGTAAQWRATPVDIIVLPGVL